MPSFLKRRMVGCHAWSGTEKYFHAIHKWCLPSSPWHFHNGWKVILSITGYIYNTAFSLFFFTSFFSKKCLDFTIYSSAHTMFTALNTFITFLTHRCGKKHILHQVIFTPVWAHYQIFLNTHSMERENFPPSLRISLLPSEH